MIIGNDKTDTSILGETEEEREEDKIIGASTQDSVIGTKEQQQPVQEPVARETQEPVQEPVDESITGEQPKEQPKEQQQAAPKQEEDPDFVDYLGDVALSPLRGVEGALEGLYGLVDYATGDRLTDWDRDQNSALGRFGKSKTTVGRFGEGLVQFAVGFVPGLGVASKAGKVLQLSKLGKASGAASKALGRLAKGNRTLDRKTLKTLSKLKKTTKVGVRNAAAGAFSDFLVWKGEEQRISNLLKSYEGLESNAIVDWMAYDPDKDEGELEGRFKNALEGLIVGELMGAAFYGAKKGYQAVAGKSPVEKAGKTIIPESTKALQGLEKLFGKFREKNKVISKQIAKGEEPNELLAVQSAMNSNQLDEDEIKAILELNKRSEDASRVIEAESISGVPISEIPIANSLKKLNKAEDPDVILSYKGQNQGRQFTSEAEEEATRFIQKEYNIGRGFSTLPAPFRKKSVKEIIEIAEQSEKNPGFNPPEVERISIEIRDDYQRVFELYSDTEVSATKHLYKQRVFGDSDIEVPAEIKYEEIDVEKAAGEAMDKWLRENSNMIPSTMSEASKKAHIKDMLKELKKEGQGVEGAMLRQENNLLKKIAKVQGDRLREVGVGDESSPEALLSSLRVVSDKPELRILFSKVARVILAKKGKEVDLKEADKFYGDTKKIFNLGLESAGGKPSSIDLEALRKSPEDMRRFRIEAEVAFKGLNVAKDQIYENLQNVKKAMDPSGPGYTQAKLDGAGDVTLSSEEALVELFSSLDRFAAIQEIWNDFGTQYSLGLRDRQLLYKTGQTSIGRDVAGQNLPLGVAIERANSHAGKLLRRAHSRGYSPKKIVKDLEKIFKKTSLEKKGTDNMGEFITKLKSEVGPTNAVSKYSIVMRKGLGVSQEWYYNAILSSPQTWAVNFLGGALVLPLRHIESIIGGVATGNVDLVKANMRAMFDFQSFRDSLKYAWKSGVDDDARSVSGYTAYRDDRMLAPQGEIAMKNPEGNTLKSAFNVIGKVVRSPSRIMMTGDEFFKQMSFRSRTKTSLALEGYKRGLHKDPNKLAEFIHDGFNELITKDGRFRNEDNVRKEAHLALNKRDKDGEITEDRSEFIEQYVNSHFQSKNLVLEDGIISNVLDPMARRELVDSGTDWALVNTFTNEVTNKFFKTTGKMATMHPSLGFVIPFVRTPSNILTFALGRTLPLGAGKEVISSTKFKRGLEVRTLDETISDLGLETGLPASRKQAEEMLSIITNEAGIKQAEAIGRLSFGVMAAGTMYMNVESLRDKITGGEPESPGLKKVWRNTGKRAYSIKIGDKWYSYQRLDPFATMIGIMADSIQLHDEAMDQGENSEYRNPEEYAAQEPYLKTIFGILATTMARNVSNKSYIENLGELMELFEEPARVGGNIRDNVLSSMAVPGFLNWSNQIYEEDPAVLEARTLMDKIKRRLPSAWRGGNPVMPVRNFLGEIQRREGGGSLLASMNPIYQSTASNDLVDLELEQHEVGRNVPSYVRPINGQDVDLTQIRNAKGQTGYDRFLELMGTATGGEDNDTLRQRLRRVIESNDYQNLPPVTSANSDKDHPRTKMLTRVFGAYRRVALNRLRRELSDFSQ